MQIPIPKRPPSFQISGADPLHVEQGHTGYAVRVGERLVGFAGENVASVAMSVEAGELHITLQGTDGKALGEYQIPSTALIRGRLDELMNAGVYFSAGESQELANLVKLSMTGGVAKSEMLLMLDEISHTAPNLNQAQTVDTGDLYPDLAKQVKQLMKAMPEEIQRFILLNNFDRFSEEAWKAFQLMAKVDPARDKSVAKFLAGGGPDFKLEGELQKIAARPTSAFPPALKQLDPRVLEQFIQMTAKLPVSGNPRLIDFAPPLANHLFENFPIDIPDFTAADSFEELQARFMVKHAHARSTLNPAERLARFLDRNRFPELADFLAGKPGAGFTTMVKASFLEFLKNPPQQAPVAGLSTVDEAAVNRLLQSVKSGPNATLLNNLNHLPDDIPHQETRRMGGVLRAMGRLSGGERRAMFVLDKLDPVRDRSLFDYVRGDHRLSKMTDSLKADLKAFMERPDFPRVHGGLKAFKPQIFGELSRALSGPGRALGDFLPDNPVLRDALYQMDVEVEAQGERALAKNARSLDRALRKEPNGEVRNQKVTDFLQRSLRNYKRVAVLDQMWKAETVAESIVKDPKTAVDAKVRALTSTLKTVKALLENKTTGMIQWDLHRDGDTVWGSVSDSSKGGKTEGGAAAKTALVKHDAEAGGESAVGGKTKPSLKVPRLPGFGPAADAGGFSKDVPKTGLGKQPKVQRLADDSDPMQASPQRDSAGSGKAEGRQNPLKGRQNPLKGRHRIPDLGADADGGAGQGEGKVETDLLPPKLKTRLKTTADGTARFLELDRWLENNFDVGREKVETAAYLKANRLLMRLERQLGTERLAPLLEKFLPLLPELESLPPGTMAEMLNDRVADLQGERRNQALSDLLKGRLRQYVRIAVLDQVWRIENLMEQMASGDLNLHDGGRHLSHSLRKVQDLLARKEGVIPDWDLWTQEPEGEARPGAKAEPGTKQSRSHDPHPPFQRRLVAEKKGLERYFHMDKVLPERPGGLVGQLEELGWSRRIGNLIERVDQYRQADHEKLLKTLNRGKPMLRELSQLLSEGESFDWMHHAKSPLNQRKQRQFQALRDALVKGGDAKLDALFEGPFLKPEFGDQAESAQAREMRRFEPMFKEAMARFANEPKQVVEEMITRLFQQPDFSQGEMRDKLGQFLENVRDFNQHQNLNNAPLYMSIPLNMGNQTGQFELAYFKLPNKKNQDRKRFLVVIHLDFEMWGHLRVDALKEEDNLSATFWVETRKMHHHLLGELHHLEDRLEELGMGDVMLNLKIEPDRAAKPLLDLCAPSSDNELDVQI